MEVILLPANTRHPALVISLSTDAIVLRVSSPRPPGHDPAEVLLRLSAAVAAALGHVPHGQWALLDADMPLLIDRSACLVEPVTDGASCSSRACAVPAASTTHAASGRRSRNPSRGLLVEGLVLLRAAHSELLLSPRCVGSSDRAD